MCMADWRIGRMIRTIDTTTSIAAPNNFTIKASRQRCAIRIAIAVALDPAFDSVAPDNPSFQVFRGGKAVAVLNVFTPIYYASFMADGDASTLVHLVQDISYGDSVTVSEWFMPESVLTAAMSEFERDYGKWSG